MRGSNFGYLVKEGARNVYSNRLMSFSCIGVLVACLLLIGSAVMFSLNVNSIVGFVEEQNEVVVFLEEGLSRSQREQLDRDIRSISNILEVTYVSKDQALENLRTRMGANAVLLDGFDESNPLPASYILRIEDLSKLGETASILRQTKGVEQVNAQTEVADILSGLKKAVGVSGMSIVAILVVVSIAIITNTIKLTVFNRRKEISIMKYVGATDSFIRLPFFVEGVLIGLISAVVAFFLLWGGYNYLMNWLRENYAVYFGTIFSNAIDFKDVSLRILGGFAALGAFIGAFSSTAFVRKYLRV